MADIPFTASYGRATLADNTVRYLRAKAAANNRTICHGIRVGANGVTPADEPILVQLLIASGETGWTTTGVTKNVHRVADRGLTVQTTCESGTTAPTVDQIIAQWEMHPQGGCISELLTEKLKAACDGATYYLCLALDAPTAYVDVNITMALICEE